MTEKIFSIQEIKNFEKRVNDAFYAGNSYAVKKDLWEAIAKIMTKCRVLEDKLDKLIEAQKDDT